MIGLCIESSHKKGMGHLFRALNLIEFLRIKGQAFVVFVNDNEKAMSILKEKNIEYELVNLDDLESDWETSLIKKYSINLWVNDRLNTEVRHSQNVVKNNARLITFDDRGSGSELAEINIAALLFDDNLKGKIVLKGVNYLILNKEIEKFKRLRTNLENIIVTLGGSDTYGVTLKVVNILKKLNKKATIHIGPSFGHTKELNKIIDNRFIVKHNLPSMIEEFYNYDLAITGGGITPFEANASGLPCLIIANEPWEIDNGRFLEALGCSKFIGHYKSFDIKLLESKFDLEELSKAGMNKIKLDGLINIFSEVGFE